MSGSIAARRTNWTSERAVPVGRRSSPSEESSDVSHDIDLIAGSVDDTYYVAKLGLDFPAADEQATNASVDVNFNHSIISSEKPVALYNLAVPALRILRYRDPIEADLEMMLLGTTLESEGNLSSEGKPLTGAGEESI